MVVDMETSDPEILVRSSPLQVRWNAAPGDLLVQIYRDSLPEPIDGQSHSPGVVLQLVSGCAYVAVPQAACGAVAGPPCGVN
jgi:hypothetical protein